jgi:hypothetical protein
MARAHHCTHHAPVPLPVLGLGAALAACCALFGTGCAQDNEDLTKQLGQLQAEIRDLRGSSLAAQDRLEALERQLGVLDQALKGVQASGETDRPSLPVVRLSPQSEEPPQAEPAPPLPDAASAGSLEPRLVLRGDKRGATLDATGAATSDAVPAAPSARPATKGPSTRAPARPGAGPRATDGAQ